jgi:hypothetical protein
MKQCLLFIAFFSALSTNVSAQTESAFASKLLGKSLSVQQEKVYLSFDKPYYSVGETMWFKAFLADATDHKTDTISSVLYVDFIDEASNRLIFQKKLKISDGNASGSFDTEGSKSGRLVVHAYTRWMRNIANDFHFNKVIQVFDPTISASNAPQNSVLDNVQFFPEGGDLIEGLPCNIAFKATDTNGKGTPIKGEIVDEKGASIVSFSDHFNGMGRFALKPEAGKKYAVKIDNSSKTFNLPNVQTSGIALTIDNLKTELPIRIFAYLNYSAEKMPASFTILAHQRGKVAFANQVVVKDKANFKTFRGVIPRTNFEGEGIVTITIFDDKGVPIAERLVFVENKKQHLNINVKTNKTTYEKREEVTVDVETKDVDGKPIAANISFGVLNSEKIGTPQYAEDLRAYMLLSSDLKGMIEQPAYYFEDTTATGRTALDNLLMTQGWRRFTWQKVLSGKADTVKYLQEFGMTVSGRIYKRKEIAANVTALVSVNSREEGSRHFSVKTDRKGYFSLDNIEFTDTAQVLVHVADAEKTYSVDFVSPPPPPSVTDSKMRFADNPTDNSTYLKAVRSVLEGEKMRVEREIQLGELEVKAKKRNAQSDIREATYTATKTFNVTDRDLGTAFDFLRQQGLDLTLGENDAIIWNDRSEFGPATIIIDNFEARASDLMLMSTDEIEKINIARNSVFPGLPNITKFIHVFTKSGNPSYYKQRKFDEKSMIPSTMVMGYNLTKQFYIPNYKEKKPEYQLPDNRTAIYWSPLIKTDKTGKTKVSFFTTDNAANMRILVEGLDKSGKLGVSKSGFKTN